MIGSLLSKRHWRAIICSPNQFFCRRIAFSQEACPSLIESILLIRNGIALEVDALMNRHILLVRNFLTAPIRRIRMLADFQPRCVLTLIRVGRIAVCRLVDDHRDTDHVRLEAFSVLLI